MFPKSIYLEHSVIIQGNSLTLTHVSWHGGISLQQNNKVTVRRGRHECHLTAVCYDETPGHSMIKLYCIHNLC